MRLRRECYAVAVVTVLGRRLWQSQNVPDEWSLVRRNKLAFEVKAISYIWQHVPGRESTRNRVALAPIPPVPALRQDRTPRAIVIRFPAAKGHRPILRFVQDVDQLPVGPRRHDLPWIDASVFCHRALLCCFPDLSGQLVYNISSYLLQEISS